MCESVIRDVETNGFNTCTCTCTCTCVSVCVKEREREKKRLFLVVCVCVCFCGLCVCFVFIAVRKDFILAFLAVGVVGHFYCDESYIYAFRYEEDSLECRLSSKAS